MLFSVSVGPFTEWGLSSHHIHHHCMFFCLHSKHHMLNQYLKKHKGDWDSGSCGSRKYPHLSSIIDYHCHSSSGIYESKDPLRRFFTEQVEKKKRGHRGQLESIEVGFVFSKSFSCQTLRLRWPTMMSFAAMGKPPWKKKADWQNAIWEWGSFGSKIPDVDFRTMMVTGTKRFPVTTSTIGKR